MAEPVFSPEIEKALNAYAVPALPQGFSDRLMLRIESGDTGANAANITLPISRTRRANPWRRSGKIIGIVGTFSLATATAAAAGFFGDPVYVPGVSEALVKAKIVEAPQTVAKPKVRMVAEAKPVDPVIATQPSITGSGAIVSRVRELRQDPEFAKLTPRERLIVTGEEVRQMVRSGEASRQDVRAAVRELVHDADPATKDVWRNAAADRREKRLNRRKQIAAPAEPQAAIEPQAVQAEPAVAASEVLPMLETTNLSPEKAIGLRESYRNATPEQRAALRAALRERRQIRAQRRGQ